MDAKVKLDNVYAVSEDVVAREIEGEIIIVPLVAGIADEEDELLTLNATGQGHIRTSWMASAASETLSLSCLPSTRPHLGKSKRTSWDW